MRIEGGGNPQMKLQTIGPMVPSYRSGLERVVEQYDLQDETFHAPVDEIIAGAERTLGEHGMDPEFLAASGGDERGLFALAIQDIKGKIGDSDYLDTCLKAVAVGEQDGKQTNYSGYVRASADDGVGEMQYLDPRWQEKKMRAYTGLTHEKLIKKFTNWGQTEMVREACSQWGEGTALHAVRRERGITPETEQSYELFVITKSMEVVAPGRSAYCTRTGVPQIVLPPIDHEGFAQKDGGTSIFRGLMEHEYGHAQTKQSLRTGGTDGVFFIGVDEGFTEASISSPKMYKEERDILRSLNTVVFSSELSRLMKDISLGDGDARKTFYHKLLKHGGSEVFLSVARMHTDNLTPSNRAAKVVRRHLYTPPGVVQEKIMTSNATKGKK